MKKNLIAIAACIFVAAAMVVYAFYFIPQPNIQAFHTVAVQKMNLQHVVTAYGTVTAATEDSLAFQKNGTLSSVNVAVGDHVTAGEVLATLDTASDAAAVAAAQATLAELSRNLTPQQQAVASSTLETAQKSAISAVAGAYTTIQNAITNDSNSLFTSPQSANPTFIVQTQTFNQQQQIEAEQVKTILDLQAWSAEIAAGTTSAEKLLSDAKHYTSTIAAFINTISTAITAFAQISSPAQTNVATYLATINTANTAIVNAQNEITSAQTALAVAQSNYNLQQAGNTAQTIAAQAAKVQQAQATLAEDSLIAPVDGTVTESSGNIGETVNANTPFIHIISDTPYQVDTYLPEDSIGLIALNQDATVTLDAYGPSVMFPAKVVTIDPGQTLIHGVGMYKVTLQFLHNDSRIKDGMTANATIVVGENDGVLAVPQSAVLANAGSPLVLVATSSVLKTKNVTVGITGANGWVEIDQGLSEGERVVTFGNQ